jgi:hypothetical protein
MFSFESIFMPLLLTALRSSFVQQDTISLRFMPLLLNEGICASAFDKVRAMTQKTKLSLYNLFNNVK